MGRKYRFNIEKMNNHITFSSNLILLDVSFLNETVATAKHILEEKLNRELPDIDLVNWLVYLALDAGLRGTVHEVQVLLVVDEGIQTLKGFVPFSIQEMDGKACQTALGEFSFALVPSAGMVSRADLFEELTRLALDAKEVGCLMLVPDFYEYSARVIKSLHDFCKAAEISNAEKAVCFLMKEPATDLLCRWDFATYSLMHAWGITSNDW